MWSCESCTFQNSAKNNACEVCLTPKTGITAQEAAQRAEMARQLEAMSAERKRNLGSDSTALLTEEERIEANRRREILPKNCPACRKSLADHGSFEPGCGHWICSPCALREVAEHYFNPRASPFQSKCSSCPMRYGVAATIELCLKFAGVTISSQTRSKLGPEKTYGDMGRELQALRETIPKKLRVEEDLLDLSSMGYELKPRQKELPIEQLCQTISEEVRGVKSRDGSNYTTLCSIRGQKPYRYLGERHYLAVSHLASREVYRRLQMECGLKNHVFTNSGDFSKERNENEQKASHTAMDDDNKMEEAAQVNIFHSPDWFSNTKGGVIFVPGGGGVQAGVWARSLLVYDSLEVGSMIPYIKYFREVHGFAILVMNPNETGPLPCDADPKALDALQAEQQRHLKANVNNDIKTLSKIEEESPAERWWTGRYPSFDERVTLRRNNPVEVVTGHESPELHVQTVFEKFVAPTASLRKSGVIAHSAGGGLILKQIQKGDFAKKSLRGLVLTDSVHSLLESEVDSVGPSLLVDALNFVRSTAPLGTIPANLYKGLPLVAQKFKKNGTSHQKLPNECIALTEEIREAWIEFGKTNSYRDLQIIEHGAVCLSSGVNDHALTNMASFPLTTVFIASRLR